jgi:hypothetical protein
MFAPNSGRRLLLGFLFAVLLGIVFAQVARAQAPGEGDPSAIIWTPSICYFLEPYSAAWYVFYCDQRASAAAVMTVPLFGKVVMVPVVVRW